MYMRIAEAIAYPEATNLDRISWAETFYDIMADNIFVPNSPTIMNAGRRLGLLSACHVLPVEDDLSQIFDSVKATAMVQRAGSGTGFNFSKLRPSGSIVKSSGGTTAGPLSFIDVFSQATNTIQQGAFRRGANMGLLNVSHPDIISFIKAKENLSRWQNYNVSIVVTDQFMNDLMDHPDNTHEVYHEAWGKGKLAKNEKTGEVIALKDGNTLNVPADVAGWLVPWTIKDTWDLICQRAWQTGEPGLFFIDEVNKDNPLLSVYGPMDACNPCGEQPLYAWDSCLTGDTLVLTDFGVEKISNIKGKLVLSTDNRLRTYTNVQSMGVKDVFKIVLSNGSSIKATDNHKFMTTNGFKEVKDLKLGDGISVLSDCTFVATSVFDAEYEMYGWMHGDGWFSETVGISFNYIDGDKPAKDRLLQEFHKQFGTADRKPLRDDSVSYQLQTENKIAIQRCIDLGFIKGRAFEKRLPFTFSTWRLNQQVSFLRGLFGADGTVEGKTDSQVQLASTSREMLDEVQNILAVLGIHSKVYTTTFTNKKRRDQHKLLITKQSANRFIQYIGFNLNHKNNRFSTGNHTDPTEFTIVSIKNVGQEEVFDIINVNSTNTFYANGMAVHNCNLGSINLAKFAMEDGLFDFDSFGTAVEIAVRFLDNVITVNKYPLPEIRHMSDQTRRIGLGVMGWADLLFKLKISYTSIHAKDLADNIGRVLKTRSIAASEELAKERGPFGAWDSSMCTERRNSFLTTVAPTGTISIIADCSCGIEPIFALAFKRTVMPDSKGTFKEMYEVNKHFLEAVNEIVKDEKDRTIIIDYVKEHGTLSGLGVISRIEFAKKLALLEKIFITSHEIDPLDHVRMQSYWQHWVDSAISKTINLKTDATVEDVSNAYWAAYETNCKGITVYRDGCRNNVAGMKQPMSIESHGSTSQALSGDTFAEQALSTAGSVDNDNRGTESESVALQANQVDRSSNLCYPALRTQVRTQFGNLHAFIVLDHNGRPSEIFAQLGKAGDIIAADLEAICRLASCWLSSGTTTLEGVIGQLEQIGTTSPLPSEHGKITSMPDALAKALRILLKESEAKEEAKITTGFITTPIVPENSTNTFKLKCPACGIGLLVFQEGCQKCFTCDYSAC